MKVAVVHYWWLSNRGGEAVLAEILGMFPDADLYVQLCDEKLVRATLGPAFRGTITQSFVGRLPFARRLYQKYLPLMPLALEQWDLSAYDLVISSEAGPAKGVITRPDALHLCYCHSPMRYIWDLYPDYLRQSGRVIRLLFPLVAHWLRVWDRASADRVDHFVANSRFVAARIEKFYRREADVIWPPVDVEAFVADRPRENFYLLLGQLVPYKRADLAIEAFNDSGLPLRVIGEGAMLARLRRHAAANIEFLGRQPRAVVKDQLERCRALVFPGIEDFGIVPVEAMAAGAPVVAYGRGGVLDTIVHGETGLLFDAQEPAALAAAVDRIERGDVVFKRSALRRQAERFARAVFREQLRQTIARHLAAANQSGETSA